jgi:inner membrane protein
MDSATNALAAAAACIVIGRLDLLPWAIAGGVAADVDALFRRFSDRDPRFFIFTHGGITHSAAGAAAVASVGVAAVSFVAGLPMGGVLAALAAGLLGAGLHLSLDLLAYPGIPLLFPASARKYTLGIFAGPSAAVFAASIIFLGCTLAGSCGLSGIPLYAGAVLCYIGLRTILKGYMAVARRGLTLPTINPFRWLVIRETETEYLVDGWAVGRGTIWSRRYPKRVGIGTEELARIVLLPEVRRLVFTSYIVSAERSGGAIRLRDPLRTDGIIWYPPHYAEVTLPETVLGSMYGEWNRS